MAKRIRQVALVLAWAVPIAVSVFTTEIHGWLVAHGMNALLGAWPLVRAVFIALPYAAVVWLFLAHRALKTQLAKPPAPPDLSSVTDLIELRAREARTATAQAERIAGQEILWLKNRLAEIERKGKPNAKT